jgi:hypothetical protein
VDGGSHDADRSRFLRARKFQLEPAYKQFIEAEKWASDNRIAELYETIDVDEYEATRKLVRVYLSLSCPHP